MTTYRIERINKELLREISSLLASRVKSEVVKEAILTGVECSRDLSHAKVYFTLLDPTKKEELGQALQEAAGTLRAFLGKQMHLHQIPELKFIYDESEIKARKLDSLIDRIAHEQGSPIEKRNTDGQEL